MSSSIIKSPVTFDSAGNLHFDGVHIEGITETNGVVWHRLNYIIDALELKNASYYKSAYIADDNCKHLATSGTRPVIYVNDSGVIELFLGIYRSDKSKCPDIVGRFWDWVVSFAIKFAIEYNRDENDEKPSMVASEATYRVKYLAIRNVMENVLIALKEV
jgi:hypothetical protein